MELLSYTTFDLIVYVEWESDVNFETIFGDLYQNKLWGHMKISQFIWFLSSF